MQQENSDQAAALLAHYGAPKAAQHYPLYYSIARALLSKVPSMAAAEGSGDAALSTCHQFLHALLVNARTARDSPHEPAKKVSLRGALSAWEAHHCSQ